MDGPLRFPWGIHAHTRCGRRHLRHRRSVRARSSGGRPGRGADGCGGEARFLRLEVRSAEGLVGQHQVLAGGHQRRQDIVLGTTGTKSVTVTYTAKDQNGVALTEAFLWQGTDSSTTDGITGDLGTDDDPVCTETATQGTYTCKAVFNIHPATDMKDNGVAGTWKLFLGAWDLYANASYNDDVATVAIKKASTLTANATPEPVKKGKTITVTGKLARANWSTGKYAGYVSQPAKLQFRKKGSNTYTTLKTVKTNSTGVLKTTTKATVDGFYRYVFAGTPTTAPATAPGDFVDVR